MAKKSNRPIVPAFTQASFKDETEQMLTTLLKKEAKGFFEILSKGGTRQDLLERVSGLEGLMSNYAKTYVDTGLSIIGRKRLDEFGRELGLTHYVYIGGLIKTTRDFCEERNGGTFTQKEVESWADEDWDGKIDGTNSENIFDYCGGWNCRHTLVPVVAPEPKPEPDEEEEQLPEPTVIGSDEEQLQAALEEVETKILKQNFESAGVYTPAGKKVFFKDGEAQMVAFTQDEVTSMKGNVLTHNHPTSNSAFSPADLNLLYKGELKEIRAVAKLGNVYSAKLTPDSPKLSTNIFQAEEKKINEAIRYKVFKFKEVTDLAGKNYNQIDMNFAHWMEYNIQMSRKFNHQFIYTLTPEAQVMWNEYLSINGPI